MSTLFEDIFNKQQCEFRKGYNTQQCLLKMLEKWKRSVDGGKVPQGLISGPLLFNIFLVDLFLVLKDVDIANFTDDNTPFTSANNIDDLIDSLEKASSRLLKWSR